MELYGQPSRFVQLETAQVSLAVLLPRLECRGVFRLACQGIDWRGWGSAPRKLLAVQREGGRLTLEGFGTGVTYRDGPYRVAALADDEVLLLRPSLPGAVLGEVLQFGNGETQLRLFLLRRRAGCGVPELGEFGDPKVGRQLSLPVRDRCGTYEQPLDW